MTFPEWCVVFLCIGFYLLGFTVRGCLERWYKNDNPTWMP